MEKKYEVKGFVGTNISFGNLILEMLKLQMFFLCTTFRGLIFAGFFPAICAVIEFNMQKWTKKEESKPLTWEYFLSLWKKNLSVANKMGWTLLLISILFVIDLNVNANMIKSFPLQIFLCVILLLIFGTFVYAFPCYIRYNLPTTMFYYKQAFFMFISSIVESIAIVLGVVVAVAICVVFPLLLPLCFAPVFLLPVSWFSLQAMEKREGQIKKKNEKNV